MSEWLLSCGATSPHLCKYCSFLSFLFFLHYKDCFALWSCKLTHNLASHPCHNYGYKPVKIYTLSFEIKVNTCFVLCHDPFSTKQVELKWLIDKCNFNYFSPIAYPLTKNWSGEWNRSCQFYTNSEEIESLFFCSAALLTVYLHPSKYIRVWTTTGMP